MMGFPGAAPHIHVTAPPLHVIATTENRWLALELRGRASEVRTAKERRAPSRLVAFPTHQQHIIKRCVR